MPRRGQNPGTAQENFTNFVGTAHYRQMRHMGVYLHTGENSKSDGIIIGPG